MIPHLKLKIKNFKLKIPKGVTAIGGAVNDPFVKNQTVFLLLSHQLHFLGCLVTMEMVRVDYSNGFNRLFLLQRVQDVFFHGLVVEHLSSANVQREAADFADEFPPTVS